MTLRGRCRPRPARPVPGIPPVYTLSFRGTCSDPHALGPSHVSPEDPQTQCTSSPGTEAACARHTGQGWEPNSGVESMWSPGADVCASPCDPRQDFSPSAGFRPVPPGSGEGG